MKLALIFVALPLAAQIHVEACGAADQGFSLPSTCYTSPITLPAGAPGYLQHERYGMLFGYHFAAPDGQYTVALHFIENSTAITGPGQRVFSASINGQASIASLDLFAVAGLNAPVDRSFQATAAAGAGLTINFAAIVRNAVISAIDITPVAQPPFPGCLPNGVQGIQCAGGFSVTPAGNAGALVMSNSANTGSFAMSTAATAGPLTVLLMPSCADGQCFGKFLRNAGVAPCPQLHPSIAALNPVCHQAEWAVPGQ